MRTPPELARVAFKPPPFWHADLELWFNQVESQFKISDISNDKTKFHTIVAALDSTILSCIKDIVMLPPQEHAHALLKNRILKHFARSENSKLNSLLKDCFLGDKRPSHLLAEMQGLSIGMNMLHTLWLQRLPVNTQQILSVCDHDLSSMAQIADKVIKVSGSSASVTEVSSGSEISSLKVEILELQTAVQNLTVQSCNQYRKFPPSRL